MNRGRRAMAHVADHLSIEELAERYRKCADACAGRHYQTIWLLAQGHTVAEVSALTSFVPRWIEELLARYNALGPSAWRSSPQQRNAPLGAQARSFGEAEGSAQGAACGWRLVDERQGRQLDGSTARAHGACVATRLGSASGDRLVDPVSPPEKPQIGGARRGRGFKKSLSQAVSEEADKHPDKPVEVWATDEHRIGLKPVHRRVWAPIGERPIGLGPHRYEWLYRTAFVAPASGETVWYLSNGI